MKSWIIFDSFYQICKEIQISKPKSEAKCPYHDNIIPWNIHCEVKSRGWWGGGQERKRAKSSLQPYSFYVAAI